MILTPELSYVSYLVTCLQHETLYFMTPMLTSTDLHARYLGCSALLGASLCH